MRNYPGYIIFFLLLLSKIGAPKELPQTPSGAFNNAIHISPKSADQPVAGACSFVQVSIQRNEQITTAKIPHPTTPNPLPLLSENFEAPLSPDWQIFDWFFGIFGGYHWGVRTDPENGMNHCAWCAAGPDSMPPLQQYPENCASWMVYGPVDLSGANWAKLHFSAWLDTEVGQDFLLWAVSLDNISFFGEGLSGNSNGWISLDFDLTSVDSLGDVTGESQVWFAFIFYSNTSVSGDGAYIDDVELQVADLNTFEVVSQFASPTPNATGLAWDGTKLFQADHANGLIYKFNSDGSSPVEFKAWAENLAGLDVKDNYLYVVDSESSRIHRLDADGDEKGGGLLPVLHPYGITWQDERLWVSSSCSDTLFLLNSTYGPEGQFFIEDIFENKFTGLTWDGNSLWLCDSTNSFIYQLDTDGNVRDYYRSPCPAPTGIAAAQEFLWCSNRDSVFKLRNPQPPFLDLEIVGIDLSAFPQITSYLSIRDEFQQPVTTLPDESFSVWENGFLRNPGEIGLRNITETAGVFLLLDWSTSMSEEDHTEMKSAAHNFVDLMGPNDAGGIIQFAGEVYFAQPLTTEKDSLHDAIEDESFIFSGGTRFYDSILQATDSLSPFPYKKAVVALTDGLDNKSDSTCGMVVNHALNADVSVYTIGLSDQINADTLKIIADSTGGMFFRAAESTQLDSIYQSISRVLSSDYVLTYESRNPAMDGTRRTLLVAAQSASGTAADTIFYQAPLPESVFLYFPDSLQANYGDTVTIPVEISGLDFTQIYGVQIECTLDPSVLKPLRVTNSRTISAPWNMLSSKIEAGNVRVGMVGTTPLTGQGTLVNVICEVVGLPGNSTALAFNAVTLNEGLPQAITQDGMFYVRHDSPFIMGKIAYYKNFPHRPIGLCQVSLNGEQEICLTSESTGVFKFDGLSEAENYQLYVNQVAVNDTAVTPGDALKILRYLVEDEKLTPGQMIAADVTGDSTISLLDASLILRHFVNPNIIFPVGVDWKFVPATFFLDSTNWHSVNDTLFYSPLEKSWINQDFRGIRLGDVNGNWQQSLEGAFLLKRNWLAFNQIFATEVNQTANGFIVLEIILDNPVNALGLSLRIPESLEFNGLKLSGFGNNFLIQHEKSGDVLRIAGAGLQDNTREQHKISLSFKYAEGEHLKKFTTFQFVDYCYDASPVFASNQIMTWSSVNEIPDNYALLPNYPNPFNANTVIRYQLPEASHVTVKIFNSLGQLVRTLVDQPKAAGYFQATWDGKDENQKTLSSGIYLCYFQAKQLHQVHKMLLLR